MKRRFLLLLQVFFLSAGTLSAQTGLLASHLQPVGTTNTYRYVHYTSFDAIDISKSGTGLTWDFSKLEKDANNPDFRLEIVNPALTPYSGSFPTSNYAYATYEAGNTTYSYFKLNADSLSRTGVYRGSNNVLKKYSNLQTEYIFPLKPGTKNNDTWMNDASMNGGEYNFECKGSGTLILPSGKSYEAYFVKAHVTEPPFIDLDANFWYSQRDGGILMSYAISDMWLYPTSAYYVTSVATGLEKEAGEQTFSYANPVHHSFLLNNSQVPSTGKYEIADLTGQLLLQGEYSSNGSQVTVDCHALLSGIYHMTFSSHWGDFRTKALKFIKQ